jgi:hypothetical protein
MAIVSFSQLRFLLKPANKAVWIVVGCCSILLFVFLVGWLFNLPLDSLFGAYFRWSYASGLEWGITFLVLFGLVYRKVDSPFFAGVYALLAVDVGGMLYELPIYSYAAFNNGSIIDHSYPLFFASQFYGFAFLLYFLYKLEFKPNKPFFASVVVYVVHGVYWFCVPATCYLGIPAEFHWLGSWIPRLFGILVLVCVTCSLKKPQSLSDTAVFWQTTTKNT